MSWLRSTGALPGRCTYQGDVVGLFEEWRRDCNPVRHLASWWALRGQPNVLFVHDADLSGDLEGEMRRVADHLHCPVPENRVHYRGPLHARGHACHGQPLGRTRLDL
jgi:hypothetical protein